MFVARLSVDQSFCQTLARPVGTSHVSIRKSTRSPSHAPQPFDPHRCPVIVAPFGSNNPRGTCELATVCGMSGMRRNPSLIRDQERRTQLSVAECALLLTRLMSQWDRLEIVTTGVCGMQQTRNFSTAATSGSKALTGIE